jgi:xylan 1,4-beta-xylosidase
VTAYYSTRNWHYAYVTVDDDGHRVLEVLSSDSGRRVPQPDCRVELDDRADRLGLRVTLDGPEVRFSYLPALPDPAAAGWRDLPAVLDATILSDEYAVHIVDGEPDAWGFTGAFVGLWVQDLGAEGGYADFDSATYRTL